ncbi:MAG TPA: sigma-70 family RNA polymerase sigma factor [Polyangiaceae bacterium]|nr:sigma-70 family RNA polymerase sigma factor [Polyangiaceae bacterium]
MGERDRAKCSPTDASFSATPPNDRLALARIAAGGDARATRALLELVAPRVIGAIRAMMGPGHPDADDACQLALIGFVQALPQFRGECDPAQFAARIGVRVASATRRRARALGARTDASTEPEEMHVAPAAPASARRRTLIRSLLDALPEEQAETLALRVVLGWSLKEISAASGAPVNTIRSRLRLAKDALRRRIASDPELADALDLREDA